MSDPIAQFMGAITAAGLTPPKIVSPDGKLHRFASNGDARDKAGWYVFHLDGIPAGAFGDFRSGLDQTWRADIDRKISLQELADCKARVEHMRRQREAEDAKVKAEARKKAVEIWDAAIPAPADHPYLAKKGIEPHGLRVHEGRLVVPMLDDAGTLHSLHLFNTMAGTIEQKTGTLREHRRLDYITKLSPVEPGGDCPMFLDFLDTIFAKDHELIDYLQKFFGYILTGETTEHSMLFFYGTGVNGKSVLISTIAGILGDYHRVAPIDTFTVTNLPGHPTDMAGLMGARLVTAIETEEGRRWAESKIKALTGGDKISARFMRGDFFEFTPAFKLIVVGNHKPHLRHVDEAMRRRLHLIPFNVTIPTEERDKKLAEKLKAEWPGILQWMIEGCLKWQAEGLDPPQSVIEATNTYLENEDTFATWIEERCELKPSYTDTSAKPLRVMEEMGRAYGRARDQPQGFRRKAHQARDRARPASAPRQRIPRNPCRHSGTGAALRQAG